MALFDLLSDLSTLAAVLLLLLYPSAYLLKYYKNKRALHHARDSEAIPSPSHLVALQPEAELKPNHDEALDDSWVQVYRTHDNAEAHLIRALLEAHSVPCFLKGEQHRSLLGWQGGILIPVDVWVPKGQAEQAKELIHSGPSAEE